MTDIQKALREIGTMAQMMENIYQECEKRGEKCDITEAEIEALANAYEVIHNTAARYEYDGFKG